MSVARSRWWPASGVAVALALLVAGMQLFHYTSLAEFTYHVAATTQSVATDAAQSSDGHGTVVYQFADLPATAQDVFRRAYESANNQTTVRGVEATALVATGDTPASPGGGLYYVVYRGSYYELTIRQPMSAPGAGTLLGYVCTGAGVLYGLYASLTHEQRARASLAFAAGVAGFLGMYGLTDWWALNGFLSLLAVGALCAFLPAVAVWSGYETLRS